MLTWVRQLYLIANFSVQIHGMLYIQYSKITCNVLNQFRSINKLHVEPNVRIITGTITPKLYRPVCDDIPKLIKKCLITWISFGDSC